MTKNEMGLVLGSFLAIFHAVWLILVALTPAGMQAFLNWIFALHGISIAMLIISVTWVGSIILVVMTFVVGYIMGWVFGWLVKAIKK